MEERIIIKGKRSRAIVFSLIIIIIGLYASLTLLTNGLSCSHNQYIYYSDMYSSYGDITQMFGTENEFALNHLFFDACIYHCSAWCCIFVFNAFLIISIITYFGLRKYSLTVTDKRVYGKIWFGKKVDIPVTAVSSVETLYLFKGVMISTSLPSLKKIRFLLIKNSDEVCDKLNDLIFNKQNEECNDIIT